MKDLMWAYSHRDDYWDNIEEFKTKEDAEKAAIQYAKEEGYREIYIGQCYVLPIQFPNVDNLLEDLEEAYAEEAGAYYDGYLFDNIQEEDKKILQSDIRKAFEDFYERTVVNTYCYSVKNIYSIKV
jgi:hypothetical protein